MNGALIIHEEEVKEGQILQDAEIIDIAPTILHLLGIPIPSDMDGKILKIFKPQSELSTKNITYQKAVPRERMKPYSEIEEEKIKKRLKELGYLE